MTCWGKIWDGNAYVDVDSNPSLGTKSDGSAYMATALAAGDSYTCAILNDDGNVNNGGPVICWGKIWDGNAYVDVDSNPSLGTKSDGSAYMATALAAGEDHTCAILEDDGDASNGGPVACWGWNVYGQTGGGTQNGYNTLTISGTLGSPDLGSQTAIAITAGGNHTCVILNDHSVKCWGDNEHGQSRPSLGTKLDGSAYMATALAAGSAHTCAILEDDGDASNGGPVTCWGNNEHGQSRPSLGTKPDGSAYMATALAAGSAHTCAILEDDGDASNGGPVTCWGNNEHGQSRPSLGTKPDGSAYMAIVLAAGRSTPVLF